MYKLLALDIDGTILRSDRGLSRETVQALARARRAGLEYTLVTGRQWAEARIVARKLDLRLPVVCQNGSHILDPVTGRELFHQTVPLDAALALTVGLEAAGVGYYWYAGQEILVPRRLYGTVMWGKRWPRRTGVQWRAWLRWLWECRVYLRFVPVDDMAAALRRCALAPTAATVWAPADRVAQMLPGHLGFDLVRNNDRSCNVVPSGTSKGQGLAFLAGHLGLDRSQIIAVGDQYNDTPMLAWAGLGVAMANAPDGVKEHSHRVIPGNDADGVAWLVDRLAAGEM